MLNLLYFLLVLAAVIAYVAVTVAPDDVVAWFQDRMAQHRKRVEHRKLQATLARLKADLQKRRARRA